MSAGNKFQSRGAVVAGVSNPNAYIIVPFERKLQTLRMFHTDY